MITRPTTLILGAGASQPFGFPTGSELRARILGLTRLNDTDSKNLLSIFGFNQDQVMFFCDSFRKSGKASIDSFLEHRQEFSRIGKYAIAVALISNEDENKLFDVRNLNWYQYLYSKITTDFFPTDFLDLTRNRLSILTFNYDRSIEHYFLHALSNSYGESFPKCREVLESIPIIHLHGDLGKLGFVESSQSLNRPYAPNLSVESVKIAMERIRIIHESIDDEPQFKQAHEILKHSEVVCFLGFGYHHLNMERLGFKSRNYRSDYPNIEEIHGSTHGLTHAEASAIGNRYGFGIDNTFHKRAVYNLDVFQYLRESGILDI